MKTSGSRTRNHGTKKPSLLTIPQLQEHVPVGTSTVGKLIRTGKLDTRKVLKRRLIVTTSAEAYFGVEFDFSQPGAAD